MHFRKLLPLLVMGVLAGCGEGETLLPNEGDPSGIAFHYSGTESGTHESGGDVQVGSDGLPAAGSWAIARPDSLGGLVIAGFEATGPGTGDLFILQIPDQAERAYACTLHGIDDGCHGRLFLGVSLADPAATDGVYVVVSGSVSLTELSDDRLRGSFSLGLAESGEGTATLEIDQGEMDLPYAEDVTLANGIACLARNLVEGRNERCL